MKTFLLTYNPAKWNWDDYDDNVARVAAGKARTSRWSVAGRKTGIVPGDRAFLLRQGSDRKGLLGSGTVVSDIYIAPHWDGSGRPANYADINWQTLVPVEDRLPTEVLKARVPDVHWGTQSSGIEIYPPHDATVESLWAAHLSLEGPQIPEEVAPGTYTEGAVTQIIVNRYERDPAARAACIAHHGTMCAVCGFDFGTTYGVLGQGFIHVHHVKEISSTGKTYKVDPIKDLRPVCPNCHAMLHRQRPALTVKQLRMRLAKP